jgi:hypothetical protein
MPERNDQSALADLLTEYVSTFEELEVVLVLARDAERSQSASDIAKAAGLSDVATRAALDRLLALGLLSRQPRRGYLINRRRPAVVAGVAALVRACETDRVAILAQLSTNALGRVRRAAARSFSKSRKLQT